MKCRSFSLVVLLVLLPLSAHAETWLPLSQTDPEAGEAFHLAVVEADSDHTVLELTVHGLFTESRTLEGTDYTALSLHAGRVSAVGHPEVPFVSRLVAIPRHTSVSWTVEALDEVALDRVVPPPVQVKPKRCGAQERPRFTCNQTIYKGDDVYPAAAVEAGETGFMRDVRFVRVQLNPVRFHPEEGAVTVARTLRVRLSHPGNAWVPATPVPPTFVRLYEESFVNGPALLFDQVEPAIERIVLYVPGNLADSLAPFVAWKRRVGYTVDVFELADVGNSNGAIKSHLQALYDNPASRPTYVILVGDVQQMPTNTGIGGCASDFKYSQLAGGDLVSDVLVSRVSAQNEAQLALQLGKFVAYEKEMPAGAQSDWLEAATCISSSEGFGDSNDDVRMDIVAGLQAEYGYDPVSKLYHSKNNDQATAVSAGINDGRGWVTYMGHGSGTSWATTQPEYSVSHVNQLTNVDRLPAVMDVSCSNGGFDEHDTCFAEAWMRAHQDGAPTGAVAIYSSSTPTPWDEPAEMAIGATKAVLESGTARWGDLCLAGRTYAYQIFGNTNSMQEVFEQYVVFGDASLMVRTLEPAPLVVEGPDVVPVGAVDETFTVTAAGQPVAGALVHLFKAGDVDVAGYTDDAGQVTFSLQAQSPGDMELTVTAFNAVPHLGTVAVVVTGCGIIKASPAVASCADPLAVTLWDQDLNTNAASPDTAAVTVASSLGGTTSLTLVETGPDTNQFAGTLDLAAAGLNVAHGADVSVSYADAACEGQAVTAVAVTAVDCQGPVCTEVEISDVTSTGAVVTFSTDEVATALVLVGAAVPSQEFPAPGTTLHVAELTGLAPATTYLVKLAATDSAGNTTVDTNGGNFYVFQTPACTPDCAGKQCGPDGCGGSCGTCDPDQECSPGGACTGGAGCEPSNGTGCDGCKCEACVCAMDPYCCNQQWDSICVDECEGDCGGCGGCTPDCVGKECGGDGCGGSCGSCPPQAPTCGANFQCSADCQPDCGGIACGDDGCGGSCGECSEGQVCQTGACIWDAGQCSEKNDPGCPGCPCEACVCAQDDYCCDYAWDDLCVEQCFEDCGGCDGECMPSCEGKECGTDDCGGACGTCEDGTICVNFECVCEPVCGENACGDDGCGGSCGECALGETCQEGACVCAPVCDGLACGDDGCGGTCGECAAGETCQDGACVCQPACDGAACGDDGCGGSCGVCGEGMACVAGACVGGGGDVEDPQADVVTQDGYPQVEIIPAGEVVPAEDSATDQDTSTVTTLGGKKSGCTASGTPGAAPWTLLVLLAALGILRRRRIIPCR